MNRKQFLDLLRKQHAYAGKADLAEVKAFVNDPENGLSFVDAAGKALNLDTVWKTVTVSVVSDGNEDVQVEQADESSPENGGTPGFGNVTASLASRGKSVAVSAGMSAPAIHGSKGKAKHYNKRAEQGKTAFSSADECAEFGSFIQKSWKDNKGKSQTLGTNSAGGYSVQTDVMADLIVNRQNVGIARKVCRHDDILRDKCNIPVRTGGLTVYVPGEATAITASDMAFGQAAYDAIQMATLTYASYELMNDSALDIGAKISDEINYAFAGYEDTIAFAPVGTSATSGLVSIPRAIYNQVVTTAGGTWATDANKLYHPGVTNAAGATWASITLANLEAVPGKLPDFAHDGACWVVSQAFWGTVMLPLALTAAGTTTTEVINGVRTPMFLGYPVIRTSKMPTASSNSQICALFGDFKATAGLADVKNGMSIDFDNSIGFNLAAVAIRGLQRSAFTAFDVGTANSSAASQVASPMCALSTLN
jgi:HK97 family phage major capsid protein